MEKDRRRAVRRHHLARLKDKRAAYYGGYARNCSEPERSRLLGLYANTACVCSCWMCGNPRRFLGERVLAERRCGEGLRQAQE